VASKEAARVTFQAVFVSPMRRALETAYLLFKDHPEFDKIQFYVHWGLREKLHVTADAPTAEYAKVEEEFGKLFKGNIDFDTYMPDKSINWFLSTL